MSRRIGEYFRRNVIALVALFFALGGGALAANKYISPSDTIPAGDLHGSTYGDPVIATGAVTNSKLADGAVTTGKFDSGAQAPDSARLAGASPSDYGAVLTGRINGLPTGEATSGAGVELWAPPSGTSNAGTPPYPTDAEVSTLSPNHDLKARDLSVNLTAAPAGTRTFFLVVNGAGPGGLGQPVFGCAITGTATSCTSSAVADVPANSTLSITTTIPQGTATAADARFAFRLTNS